MIAPGQHILELVQIIPPRNYGHGPRVGLMWSFAEAPAETFTKLLRVPQTFKGWHRSNVMRILKALHEGEAPRVDPRRKPMVDVAASLGLCLRADVVQKTNEHPDFTRGESLLGIPFELRGVFQSKSATEVSDAVIS